jgi:monothiol glutaredoxin
MKTKEEIFSEIESEIKSSKIVAYIKGTTLLPQCGFSHQAVQILKSYEVDFKTVNILSDNQKREVLKEFSDWPTYPQIFVDGELVGGVDILRELHESGELATKLK